MAGSCPSAPARSLRSLASHRACPRSACGSPVRGDPHAGFCESRGVRFPPATHLDPGESADVTSPSHIVAHEVRQDAEAWCDVRKVLNHRRSELTKVASSLYSGAERIAGTPLITSPEWMPVQPVDLEAIRLAWTDNHALPFLTGHEAETEPCRPQMAHGGRYPRYCQAIRDLDPP
jgi:hypothetical protein